jgi:hypothetical protein
MLRKHTAECRQTHEIRRSANGDTDARYDYSWPESRDLQVVRPIPHLSVEEIHTALKLKIDAAIYKELAMSCRINVGLMQEVGTAKVQVRLDLPRDKYITGTCVYSVPKGKEVYLARIGGRLKQQRLPNESQ